MTPAYTKADYQALLDSFALQAEQGYTKHSNRTIPDLGPCFGVRTPFLRACAKEVLKGDWQGFLAVCGSTYHEERMLRAMVVAGLPYPRVLDELRAFIPLVNNWAVCDTLCADFKTARRHPEEVWNFLTPYFTSGEEFGQRTAAVMLLWHYTDDKYAPRALEVLKTLRHPGYYTRMAVAWAVCEFFIKQRDLTLPLLQSRVLSPWVQNKTIQKIRESYRVNAADKQALTAYKFSDIPRQ